MKTYEFTVKFSRRDKMPTTYRNMRIRYKEKEALKKLVEDKFFEVFNRYAKASRSIAYRSSCAGDVYTYYIYSTVPTGLFTSKLVGYPICSVIITVEFHEFSEKRP